MIFKHHLVIFLSKFKIYHQKFKSKENKFIFKKKDSENLDMEAMIDDFLTFFVGGKKKQ